MTWCPLTLRLEIAVEVAALTPSWQDLAEEWHRRELERLRERNRLRRLDPAERAKDAARSRARYHRLVASDPAWNARRWAAAKADPEKLAKELARRDRRKARIAADPAWRAAELEADREYHRRQVDAMRKRPWKARPSRRVAT